MFIANHYKEATQVIEVLESDLTCDTKELGCSNEDFEHHLAAEREYLAGFNKPDPVADMKGEYVKALCQMAIDG